MQCQLSWVLGASWIVDLEYYSLRSLYIVLTDQVTLAVLDILARAVGVAVGRR